ncbi:nigrelysin-like [Anoplopoma fimbria]|uniref:nigrelysin-like n=1 Tax=Anoplopoma fimbria TaxID=229290 RepID=UPI0023ED2ED8|nr:nigrelysin-like [Anoplopoma fimbria]
MSESAEALAATQTSRRNVTIEITNLTSSYCLIDPKVYLNSGNCHSPPQPTVRPLKTEVCNFSKTSGKATGAVGVLTYDLFEKSNGAKEKLAIMFSVPYDNNTYKNWLALGIYTQDKECNEKLYEEMYENKEMQGFVRAEAKGCSLTYEGTSLDIKATMSPLGRAMLKVEVWDKLFTPMLQQHH